MNREEIKSELEKIGKATKPNETVVANIADFILANFTPKGEAEKVTAKEIYIELIKGWSSNSNSRGLKPSEITEYAFNCAAAFNSRKPE